MSTGAPPGLVRARLHGPAMDALARLLVDDLLHRPVQDLIDPALLARQAVAALRAATKEGRVEAQLRRSLRELQQKVPPGRPGDDAPPELVGPLKALLARPVAFDRALVHRLVDHPAIRRLLRDLLVGALHGFAERLRNLPIPPAPASAQKGLGRLKALGGGLMSVGEELLGGVSKELEARTAQRIHDFVDDALAATMAQMADHLCDPAHAGTQGAFRAHILDVLLSTENAVLVAEMDKFGVDAVVDAGAAVARGLAARPTLDDEARRFAQALAEATAGRTAHDLLAEAGLAEDTAWRADLEAAIAARGRALVGTDGFGAWLDALLAPGTDGPAGPSAG